MFNIKLEQKNSMLGFGSRYFVISFKRNNRTNDITELGPIDFNKPSVYQLMVNKGSGNGLSFTDMIDESRGKGWYVDPTAASNVNEFYNYLIGNTDKRINGYTYEQYKNDTQQNGGKKSKKSKRTKARKPVKKQRKSRKHKK